MTLYINTKTNVYPLYLGDLALEGITPENLPDYIEEVVIEIPEYNQETEYIYEESPERKSDGKIHAVVKKRLKTEKELQEEKLVRITQKVVMGESLTEEEAQLLSNR